MTDCGLKAARRWFDAALGRGPRRRIESIFSVTWRVEKELAEHIESSAGLMLQNIFHVHGEEYCRRLEREVLVEFLAARPSAVLAAGGGIVTREDTYGLLRQHLRHILVEKADPEDHWNRVLEQDPRPMANNQHPMDQLQAILRRREPLYAIADHTIDTSSIGISTSIQKVSTCTTNNIEIMMEVL